DELERLVAIAAVRVHLAATRLLDGEYDLVPEPLQELDRRSAGLRVERVAETRHEERDPHHTTVLEGRRCSSSTSRSACTASRPMSSRVARVALPRCGVRTTFSSVRRPGVTSGSC